MVTRKPVDPAEEVVGIGRAQVQKKMVLGWVFLWGSCDRSVTLRRNMPVRCIVQGRVPRGTQY